MKIKPANRILKVEEYYFSKKLAEVERLRKKGKDIINLGVGNPDFPPHPEVMEALHLANVQIGSNYYQSYRGIPELRIAFSEWYKKIYKVNIKPETEILPLIGSKEGIMHISMAFTNAGDTVLVPNPGYPAYTSVAKLLNLKIRYYNLIEENNWLPDIAELKQLVNARCKIMWVNYPHMPTGATSSIKDFKELIDFCKMNNILLVNDNPYSLILNKKPLSLLSETNKDNLLELNSLSKSHNMAGWRIGMVAGNKENINHILRVKSNFDSGMFKPIQMAAVKALELPFNWYNELNIEYAERRKKVWEILNYLHCKYSKDTSGLFVWAKIPANFKSGEEFSDFLLYNLNIFVTPGKVFGSNGANYIRISLCADMKKLDRVLQRIITIKRKVA